MKDCFINPLTLLNSLLCCMCKIKRTRKEQEMEIKEVSTRETAKLLRRALKSAFPKTPFWVVGVGGGEIVVTWQDEPSYQEVSRITSQFNGVEYDEHFYQWGCVVRCVDGEPTHYNAHISLQRNISDHLWLETAKRVAAEYGLPEPSIIDRTGEWALLRTSTGEQARVMVNRALNK